MPTLPWSTRGSLPPTYACYVTASRQVARGYRNLPAQLWRLRELRIQLRDARGVLGFAFAARLRDRTFWTVVAWVDPDAAALFAKTHADAFGAFAPQTAASTEVSWSCLAEELPVTWPDAHRRIAPAAAAAGHCPSGALPPR